MVIVGILSWWYGRGFIEQLLKVRARMMASFDYFSIDLLASTLFSPFRQISAGKVRGPLGIQIRAFFDRLFSRGIGAIVRMIVMVIGIIWLLLLGIFGVVQLIIWVLLPLAPFVAVVLWLGGALPWHL